MSEPLSQLPPPGDSEPPPSQKKPFNFWKFFWLTFLVVSLAFAWYSFYAPPNHIAWADNFNSAQLQAADSGKPIILYFTGKWCSPCRIMKRQVWADAEVEKAVNSRFIPVAIDVDNPSNATILARYKVSGAPVTIIADPKGDVLRWRAGGIGKSQFIELLGAPTPPTTIGL